MSFTRRGIMWVLPAPNGSIDQQDRYSILVGIFFPGVGVILKRFKQFISERKNATFVSELQYNVFNSSNKQSIFFSTKDVNVFTVC